MIWNGCQINKDYCLSFLLAIPHILAESSFRKSAVPCITWHKWGVPGEREMSYLWGCKASVHTGPYSWGGRQHKWTHKSNLKSEQWVWHDVTFMTIANSVTDTRQGFSEKVWCSMSAGSIALLCLCNPIDSLWSHGLQLARLLCPWKFSGKNTGVGCHFLLQGIFPTQSSHSSLLCLLHWQVDSVPLYHLGSPLSAVYKAKPMTGGQAEDTIQLLMWWLWLGYFVMNNF